MTETTETDNPSRAWAVVGVGALVLLMVGASVALTLQSTGEPSPVDLQNTVAPLTPEEAAQHRPPSAFGLPAYPGAFHFFSTENDAAHGSSVYSVPKGNSAEVIQFYTRELGRQGWRFVGKQAATERPAHVPNPLTLRGTRTRWRHAEQRRQLTVLALDDVRPGRTAQVVVSWANDGSGRTLKARPE